MSRYDLQELKARTDLAALVAERVGAGKRVGRRELFTCPNPAHEDRHPSFDVDTIAQVWRCRSACNEWGDAIDLLVWLDGWSKADAIAYLAERCGLEPVDGAGHRRGRSLSTYLPKTPAPTAPVVHLVEQSTDTARRVDGAAGVQVLDEFLASRGWSRETAELVGLSVVQHRDGYRVRFPFLRDGVAMVWQDRAAQPADHPQKWRAPKGATLYPFGLDCLHRYDGPADTWPTCPLVGTPAVWLCEGPADAVTLLEHFPTISALGLPGVDGWRDEYAAALAGVPVVLVADNDDAGTKLRTVVARSLAGRTSLVQVHVPEAHNDLGDWHQAAGESFAGELMAAVDDALAAWLEAVTA